jgi:hypothetical protein
MEDPFTGKALLSNSRVLLIWHSVLISADMSLVFAGVGQIVLIINIHSSNDLNHGNTGFAG